MPNLIDRLRSTIGRSIMPQKELMNSIQRAFYQMTGVSYTAYDVDGKTYLEKGYGKNPDVYAVINQMSTKTASVPYVIKKVKDEGAKKHLDRLNNSVKGNFNMQQEFKKRILETKAFEEEILEFPLDRPNPLQTWSEIYALYKTFLKLTGNVYFYIVSPDLGVNQGKPLAIYIMPSHQMNIVLKPTPDLTDTESPIDYYTLIEGQTYVKFQAKDIIHVKYPNPFYDQNGSHLYGLAPTRAGLRNIQSSNEAIDLNNKTMKNGGAFGFIYGKGGIPLTSDQAGQLKTRLREMDMDQSRLGQIAGVSAEVGFTRIALSTDELKPFDFLKHDQKTICNIYNWDDKLLNNDEGSKSHLNGLSQAWQGVLINNIMPDLKLLEEAFNTFLLPRFKELQGAVIYWDISELPEMQKDMETLSKWVLNSVDKGVITRQEARIALKFPESKNKDLDVFTVSGNIMPLSDALLSDEEFNIANQSDDE